MSFHPTVPSRVDAGAALIVPRKAENRQECSFTTSRFQVRDGARSGITEP